MTLSTCQPKLWLSVSQHDITSRSSVSLHYDSNHYISVLKCLRYITLHTCVCVCVNSPADSVSLFTLATGCPVICLRSDVCIFYFFFLLLLFHVNTSVDSDLKLAGVLIRNKSSVWCGAVCRGSAGLHNARLHSPSGLHTKEHCISCLQKMADVVNKSPFKPNTLPNWTACILQPRQKKENRICGVKVITFFSFAVRPVRLHLNNPYYLRTIYLRNDN